MKQYILCSAIHFDNGIKYEHQPKNIKQGIVVCGRRHHNCFTTYFLTKQPKGTVTQGFLTNDDQFLNRQDAFQVASKANQLINPIGTVHTLLSEDLW